MTKRWTAALLVLPLLLGAAACGDDDDEPEAADASASEADEEPADGGEAAASPEACDAYLAVTQAFNSEPDPAVVDPLLDEIEATKPAAIDAELQLMVDSVREAFETGEFEFFDSDEFQAASQTVDNHLFESCEADTKLDVDAIDYAFTGFPDEVDAGLTFVRITNATTKGEMHEIAVMSKNEGVTQTWDELFALEEEGEEMVTFHGAAFAESEGDTGVAYLDLEPGDYVAVCFVSVGSGDEGGEEGPPHHTEGMVHEFTVS